MRCSPRILRPHTVTIRHKTGEDDAGSAMWTDVTVQHVKFKPGYTKTHGTRGSSDDTGGSLLSVDLGDYMSSGWTYGVWGDDTFGLEPDDEVIFQGKSYTVTKVDVLPPASGFAGIVEAWCS